MLIYWLICEVFLMVAIDVGFISEATQKKTPGIEVSQINKKHRCLQILNVLNVLIAVAFLALFLVCYSSETEVLRNVLWIAFILFSLVYLLIWSGALIFIYRKIAGLTQMQKILPNRKLFLLMALLLFASLLFNSLAIFLFTAAGVHTTNCDPNCEYVAWGSIM